MKLLQNSFLQFFGDGIYHTNQAKTSDIVVDSRHIRSAIINLSISLECAANACIVKTLFSNKCREELDKLTPISKFEVFASCHNKQLDRGRVECQGIVEIAQIRNQFVHPKVTNVPIEMTTFEELKEGYSLGISLTGSTGGLLGIDRNSIFWSTKNCMSVLQAVVSFYNFYFVELLEISPQEILSLLCPLWLIDGSTSMVFSQECFENDINLLASLGIENKFLQLAILPKIANSKSSLKS